MRLTAALAQRLDKASTAPVAVAFSGGPDSYLALVETIGATRRPVIALHVDHGLNPRSSAWAASAETLARQVGADFRLLRWEGEKPRTGVPAAARAARHRLLADAARETGAKVIVTGHTGDDALENQALGQGTLFEWAPSPAWPEGRGVFLLRPLLQLRRAQIRERLAAQRVLPRLVDDPANEDAAHPRIAARRAIAGRGEPPAARWNEDAAHLARRALFQAGAVRLPRRVFDAAGGSARARVLSAAMVCTGGGRKTASAERLVGAVDAGAHAATLAGAKLLVDANGLLIVRNAGETARGGLPPLDLSPRQVGVFDGRYEVTAGAAPVRVVPLKGLARRLPELEQQALASLPAHLRPSLPVLLQDGTATCPILAQTPLVEIRPLAGARFLAACGAIAHEGDI